MTKEDLLLLIKAGYSKKEIDTLFGLPTQDQAQAQVAAPAQAQAQVAAPVQAQAPAPAQAQAQVPAPEKSWDDVYREIVGLKDMIQTENIITQGHNNIPKEVTAVDDLASILDPMGHSLDN